MNALSSPERLKAVMLTVPRVLSDDKVCALMTISFYYWDGNFSWWRHQMETFSALLAHCEGNPPVTGGFPSQRPETRSFHVFFDLRLNIRLNKQWRRRWFAPSPSLWRQCHVVQRLQYDACHPDGHYWANMMVPYHTVKVTAALLKIVCDRHQPSNEGSDWLWSGSTLAQAIAWSRKAKQTIAWTGYHCHYLNQCRLFWLIISDV